MNPLTISPKLTEILGYSFNDPTQLLQALTHRSFIYENHLSIGDSNERLEFLGDAVLELLSSDILYNRYSELSEGELSRIRACIVCEQNLASHARQIGLGDHIRLGRGEAFGGGADKDSILSDALEAVIGAMYLDGGINSAFTFVEGLFFEQSTYDKVVKQTTKKIIPDPKSTLQEKVQKLSPIPLTYNIIKDEGPQHCKKFTVTVSFEGQILGTGIGKTKKEAGRNAAAKALSDVNLGYHLVSLTKSTH
ncbi:MAG: ribonuclease III [Defluviitaleaceae bacterium]|nr:ribonuclease III [Defluviitaleaceae bacterium]